MPRYDFTCKKCSEPVTFIVPYGEYPNIDKDCPNPACDGVIQRLYAGLNIGVIFKGSGWAGKDLKNDTSNR